MLRENECQTWDQDEETNDESQCEPPQKRLRSLEGSCIGDSTQDATESNSVSAASETLELEPDAPATNSNAVDCPPSHMDAVVQVEVEVEPEQQQSRRSSESHFNNRLLIIYRCLRDTFVSVLGPEVEAMLASEE